MSSYWFVAKINGNITSTGISTPICYRAYKIIMLETRQDWCGKRSAVGTTKPFLSVHTHTHTHIFTHTNSTLADEHVMIPDIQMIYQTRLEIMKIYWHCTIIHSAMKSVAVLRINGKLVCCNRKKKNKQNEKENPRRISAAEWENWRGCITQNNSYLIQSVIWCNFELIWKCNRIVSNPSARSERVPGLSSIWIYTSNRRCYNRIIFELNIN